MKSERRETPGWLEAASWVLILLATGAFLLLNAFRALRRTFWLDEASTGLHVMAPWAEFWTSCREMAHAPLYYALLKIWSLVPGPGELGLMSFSLFFSLASVALAVAYARRISREPFLPLAAAAAFLGNLTFWSFALNAKQYSLAGFLSLAAFILLAEAHFRRDRILYALALLVLVAANYTHPWGLLLSALLLFSEWFLAAAREGWTDSLRRRLPLVAVAALLSIPALQLYLGFREAGAVAWIEEIGPLELLAQAGRALAGSIPGAAAYLFLVPVGLFLERRFQVERKAILFRFGFLSTLLALAAFLLANQAESFHSRYVVIFGPPLWMAVAAVAAALLRRLMEWKSPALLTGTLIAALLVASAGAWRFRDSRTVRLLVGLEDEGWTAEQVLDRVLEESRPGDIFLLMGRNYAVYRYYCEISDDSCNRAEIVAFPREMEDHPGYIDFERVARQEEQLRRDFARLLEQLEESPGGERTVWIFEERWAGFPSPESRWAEGKCREWLDLSPEERTDTSVKDLARLFHCSTE